MARPPKKPKNVDDQKARRGIVPTTELHDLAKQQEEASPRPPVHIQRAQPLPKGQRRERDEELDPQIVWNGARIRLTRDQVRALQETGEVEIGDAQLVWRGKDSQDWSDLIVNQPMIFVQEKIHPKVDHRRPEAAIARGAEEHRPRTGPLRRFQRPRRPGGAGGVLPARHALVEPHDPRRFAAGNGVPRRTRSAARKSPVHLFRPALRHQVQFELAGLHPFEGCEGRQADGHRRASRSR